MSGMSTFGGDGLGANTTREQQRRAVDRVVQRFPDRDDHWPILQALFAGGRRNPPRGLRGRPARSDEGLRPCGTEAAYQRHKARGEDACDACRAAANAVRALSKQRRQEVA